MRRVFLIVIAFCFSCNNHEPSYIVVSGTAKVDIPIDFMYVNISIFEDSSTPNSARNENIPKVKNVLSILHELGVKDSAITTTDYSISTNRQNEWDNNIPKNGKIKFSYSLRAIIYDISKYEILQAKMAKAGVSYIDITGYGSNNMQKYDDLLYEQALKNAKNRAVFLVEKNNQHLGKIYKLLGFGNDINNRYEDIDNTIDYFLDDDLSGLYPSAPIQADEEYFEMDQLLKIRSFQKQVKITVAYFIEQNL